VLFQKRHIETPIINSAIPKKAYRNTAKVDAISKKDIAMAKAPTQMLNHLAEPELWVTSYSICYMGDTNEKIPTYHEHSC
jgi:hypothetical protein